MKLYLRALSGHIQDSWSGCLCVQSFVGAVNPSKSLCLLEDKVGGYPEVNIVRESNGKAVFLTNGVEQSVQTCYDMFFNSNDSRDNRSGWQQTQLGWHSLPSRFRL